MTKEIEVLKTIGAWALVIAAVILGWAFFPEKANKQDGLSKSMYSEFMTGCVETSGMFSECDCAYNHIVKQIGEDKLLRLSTEYAITENLSDELAEILVNASVECVL
jgi:hypothetical protein